MTLTEKILARASGKARVQAGDNIWVKADVLMTHDVCGPGTIGVFKREFGATAKVWDRNRIVIIPDHYIFTADSKSHRNIEILRDFVKRQGITSFYDPDFIKSGVEGMPPAYADAEHTTYRGVCHAALPQNSCAATPATDSASSTTMAPSCSASAEGSRKMRGWQFRRNRARMPWTGMTGTRGGWFMGHIGQPCGPGGRQQNGQKSLSPMPDLGAPRCDSSRLSTLE